MKRYFSIALVTFISLNVTSCGTFETPKPAPKPTPKPSPLKGTISLLEIPLFSIMHTMSIHDEVEHQQQAKLEVTKQKFDNKAELAKFHMVKAGEALQPFLHKFLGFATVLFYSDGISHFEGRTFCDLRSVPESLAIPSIKEFNIKCMEDYGHERPKEKVS
jgi:hypothetical protein